jgi:2-polyprenyl-3-methyl-5-hydroxy-6-metoxy-1,4-benzoquinol methylase
VWTVLGCGNSSLSADLHQVGWRHVTNIDISPVVLRRNMRKQERTPHTYLAMDMTNMTFRDHTFDIVIEKAGRRLGSKFW